MRRFLCVCIFGLWSPAALAQSIGVFADPLGIDCNLMIPYPGGPVTGYVVGDFDAVAPVGILVASFRIEGLPEGWTASVTRDPASNILVGDLFAAGVAIGYPSCVAGPRVLLTLSITPNSSVQNGSLVISYADADYRSCGWEGRVCNGPCPQFCACQDRDFGLDCYCAESMPTTINGPPCVVNTAKWSWGQVKRTYK